MVGALVVTHGDVARELVSAAYRIMGENKQLRAVCIGWDEDVATARRKIEEAILQVEHGSGVLIMTDMFGGTASNLSLTLLVPGKVEVVTGVNLSMLLKLGNTATERLSLSEVAEAVCGRGRESIRDPLEHASAEDVRGRPMIEAEIKIVNQLGLHMRAAGKFAKTAGRFRARVILMRDGVAVDGKSIVGLLTLAASRGSSLTLRTDGEDESAAFEALKDLVAGKFGEEQ